MSKYIPIVDNKQKFHLREEQSFRNPRSINVKIKLAQSSQLWIYNGYIMDMDMDMDMDISLPG